MRRRADGTYEPIDWDTAIAEVAAGFARSATPTAARRSSTTAAAGRGTTSAAATRRRPRAALGSTYRSNALAQEKTGEFWVNGKMLGGYVRGDFEHAEVAVFVGKNPWQSHSFPHARTTLKEIARDPNRSMVVIDPRRTETAELADFHLALRPGTDAWCLAALGRGDRAGGPARPAVARRAHRRARRDRAGARRRRRRRLRGDLRPRSRPGPARPRAASPPRPASRCSRTSACR